MSIFSKYVKKLYVENVLKDLRLALRVDCIFRRGCVLEFTSRLWDRQNLSSDIMVKTQKRINRNELINILTWILDLKISSSKILL
jgi:hypothetical protein